MEPSNASRLEMYVFHVDDELKSTEQNDNAGKKIIGYFSVNGNQEYCSDASQLKYIYYKVNNGEEKVNFNLNHMAETTVKKNVSWKNWDKLNHMFTWLSLNSSRLFPIDDVVFLTYRGNLTTIFCSPYEQKDDWTICARLCNGVIYLNSFETDNDIRKAESETELQKKCASWGFKFEQYMLTNDPNNKPNPNEILNENEEYCCVFDRKLGNHRIIYGAEMDGIVSDKLLEINNETLSKAEFVELKTNKKIERYNQDKNFRRFKMLKWWCQSYLVGIDTIICGFRDDNGIIRKLKRYDVNEFPKLAAGLWDKNICINFCIRFLSFVKRVVLENCTNDKMNDDVVWKFDLFPQHKICASKVNKHSTNYTTGFKEIKISEMNG